MDYLLPFPVDKGPHGSNQESILTQGGCRAAMHKTQILIRTLLKGIDVRIREVCLRIKNPAIMVTGFSPNKSAITTSARHVVHQITLPSGERYALDLTAAQYGWYGPAVMPWHMFEVERLDGSLKTSGMGETAKELQNEVHGLGLDRKYEHEMTDLMTKCFNMCLAKWEQKKMPLKALLRLPEEAFTGEQDSLLDFMEWHVSAVKAEINERMAMANQGPH